MQILITGIVSKNGTEENTMDQQKNLKTNSVAEENAVDPDLLLKLVSMKIPFGKYKGTLLPALPIAYLEWFARKGFPPGKLGAMLQTVYEIKLNGLEYLLEPLKRK